MPIDDDIKIEGELTKNPWKLWRVGLNGEKISRVAEADGRGRHPTAHVSGDFAAHCGTTAAINTSTGMRQPMVMRSRATNGRSATKCQGKQPDQADRLPSGRVEWWQQSAPRAGLVGRPEKRKYSRRFGVHLGNVGSPCAL